MLTTASDIAGTPVMSLQTGQELARIGDAIIDPGTLKVLAYEVVGPLVEERPKLLTVEDIREVADVGFIVDSNDDFISPEDVVKIQPLYDLRFDPIRRLVRDENKHKIGKVVNYTIELGGFVIQQLVVKRSLLHINDTELLVHRTQIIEINDQAIVVHSQAKAPEPERGELPGAYVNPFRKADTQGEPQP